MRKLCLVIGLGVLSGLLVGQLEAARGGRGGRGGSSAAGGRGSASPRARGSAAGVAGRGTAGVGGAARGGIGGAGQQVGRGSSRAAEAGRAGSVGLNGQGRAGEGRPSQRDLGRFLELPGATDGPVQGVRGGERRSSAEDAAAQRRAQAAQGREQFGQQREVRSQEVRAQAQQVYSDLFTPGWRAEYPQLAQGYFHYQHPYAHHWWRPAAWAGVAAWIAAPAGSQGVYYDYSSSGDTVYTGDSGQAATTEDYSDEAVDLAAQGTQSLAGVTVTSEQQAAEWMPLGVFALTPEAGGQPVDFLQLAINKQGVLAGQFYSGFTGESVPVQGAVDRDTQRAAWSLGNRQQTVLETGLYNLTRDESPVLVHFASGKRQTWLLVRLEEPLATQE